MVGVLLTLVVASAAPGSVAVSIDGARSLGEAARPAETVVLGRSGVSRVGRTDPGGAVVFQDVAEGRWDVWRSLDHDRPGCWERGVVTVQDDADATIHFGAADAADASAVSCGFVHEIPGKKSPETRPGVLRVLLPFDTNLGSEPVPAVLKRPSGRTVARVVLQAGANTIEGVRPGTYTLVAHPPRMAPVVRTVRLASDLGTKLTLDLHPPPAEGVVRVQVVSTTKRIPAGVVVQLEDASGVLHTATTDPSGWVALADIPAGTLTLWSNFAGFDSDPAKVVLTSEQGLEHRMEVDLAQPEGTLRVIGMLPRYGPAYGVSTVLLAGTERVDTMVPVSGEQVMQGVPTGEWMLHKASDGTPLCPLRVPVESGATTVLWFEPTHTMRPCVYRVFPQVDAG